MWHLLPGVAVALHFKVDRPPVAAPPPQTDRLCKNKQNTLLRSGQLLLRVPKTNGFGSEFLLPLKHHSSSALEVYVRFQRLEFISCVTCASSSMLLKTTSKKESERQKERRKKSCFYFSLCPRAFKSLVTKEIKWRNSSCVQFVWCMSSCYWMFISCLICLLIFSE